jgi:hypothetical protein
MPGMNIKAAALDARVKLFICSYGARYREAGFATYLWVTRRNGCSNP